MSNESYVLAYALSALGIYTLCNGGIRIGEGGEEEANKCVWKYCLRALSTAIRFVKNCPTADLWSSKSLFCLLINYPTRAQYTLSTKASRALIARSF